MTGSLKDLFNSYAVKPKKKRPAPLSIRLSAEERARLEEDAAGLALSAYIKTVLFEGGSAPRKTRRSPVKDYQKLALALDALGRLNALNTFNTLLKASEAKHLDLAPATEAEIRKACADIALIRRHLITALGVKAE